MTRLSDSMDVKGLHVRNRLVMAPMVTGLALEHAPTEAQIDWYRQRVRGGVGLVVVESAAIAPDGLLLQRMLGIWEDAQVPGLSTLASAIRAEGVPAVLQIVHGGARAYRAEVEAERIGPSPVALVPGPAPREMKESEIQGVIEAFAQAARRAKEAGFDGVELHAAHHYLLSQFLCPATNRRTDRWGQDRAGRIRLLLEVVQAVRAQVGDSFPLFVRLHGVEHVEGGLTAEDALYNAQALEAAGVDLLDVSGIGQSSVEAWREQPYLASSSVLPKDAPAGAFAPHAGKLRAAVSIPVITVCKMAEPGVAQAALDRGDADLVALARPLIADPQVARKLLEGRDDEILRCRECMACFKAIRRGPIKCSVNTSL